MSDIREVDRKFAQWLCLREHGMAHSSYQISVKVAEAMAPERKASQAIAEALEKINEKGRMVLRGVAELSELHCDIADAEQALKAYKEASC